MIALHQCQHAVERGCKGARRAVGGSHGKAPKREANRSWRRTANQGLRALGEAFEADYMPRLTSWDVS